MSGSKMNIWKQDPRVLSLSVRSTYVHTQVQKGPKDEMLVIKNMPEISPTVNNDFLFSPSSHPTEFDAVHTFAVVRQVITMYNRALRRMGLDAIQWQWGDAPIKVYPHAGIAQDAYYSRNERALKFFYFPIVGDDIFTCRSFEIVAHECAHAILDGLRPGYWGTITPQTGGLSQSFADLTAIFIMLSQMDICETIIAELKGDLNQENLFSAIAKWPGGAFGRPTGLHNANNKIRLSEVSTQVHDIAQVFTGAVYDIIADLFKDHIAMEHYDPAETLFRIGRHVCSLLVAAIINGPEEDATYHDIATQMITLEKNDSWRTLIKARFEEREVMNPSLNINPLKSRILQWDNCYGTVQTEEYQHATKRKYKSRLVNNHVM